MYTMRKNALDQAHASMDEMKEMKITFKMNKETKLIASKQE